MPHTHQILKKSLSSGISGPDDESVPDTTHFNPYFPSDLQNELADSLDGDSDDLSQIDHPGITVHNVIPDGNNRIDLPALIISSSTDSYDDQELDSSHSTNVQESPNRVRFRSRVRITSGLNRHRRKSQQHHHNQSGLDYLSFSPASSSVSGSPSSSISVPLRTHTDEQVGKPGWGTLGQRVSLFAKGNMERRKLREQREQLSSFRKFRGGDVIPHANTAEVNEQTPLLLSPPSRPLYLASNATDHRDSDSADEASQISREVEMVFGSWPGRLANYHWWWWQMEPLIFCHCLCDPDEEG